MENDVGAADQTFTVHVEGPSADAGVAPDAAVGPDAQHADAGPGDGGSDGCACSAHPLGRNRAAGTLSLFLLVVLALRRRTRIQS